MNEPLLKAVTRRSVFLQPLYWQETDNVEKTPNSAGTPFVLQS